MNRIGIVGWLTLALLAHRMQYGHAHHEKGFYELHARLHHAVDARCSEAEEIDVRLRAKFSMQRSSFSRIAELEYTALAAVRPDREDYAASVPKIGILLAYFQLHPEAAQISMRRPPRIGRYDQAVQQRNGGQNIPARWG